MTPSDLLARLHAGGLLPRAAGGRLFVQKDRLTPELSEQIAARRDALIPLLLKEQALADAAAALPPPWGGGGEGVVEEGSFGEGEGFALVSLPATRLLDPATGQEECQCFPAGYWGPLFELAAQRRAEAARLAEARKKQKKQKQPQKSPEWFAGQGGEGAIVGEGR